MTQQLAPTLDRAYARAFVDSEIMPYADGWDRAGAIPEELLERIAAAGLWAPFLPLEFGGSALDMVTLGEIHEEVGRGCSSVRSLLTVHTMLSWALQRWGSRRAAGALGPGAGRRRGCSARSACPSRVPAATPPASPRPPCRTGGGWLLNGVKTWITNGQRADLYLVFARAGPASRRLLVPARRCRAYR